MLPKNFLKDINVPVFACFNLVVLVEGIINKSGCNK
jgi:hypothetical protein